MRLNIVICGGHLSPALAVIEKLRKRRDYQIFYIGRKNVFEGDKAISLEYATIKKLNIPFYFLSSSRWQRSTTRHTLPSLLKFPFVMFQSLVIILRIRPKIVVSFGGYVALPVCISAWLLGIPVITHEQTHILGLANRIISRFAKIVCLSWPDTKYLPKNIKTVVVGNPIRETILYPAKSNLVNFGNKELPILYITGGSLGSQSINEAVKEALPYLASRFRIIHQCGIAGGERDFKSLTKHKSLLPEALRGNYCLVKHTAPAKVGSILKQSSLVISRAGANTVLELEAAGTPTIFIPLPWAADMEQEYNAKILEKDGQAIIIKQEQLTSHTLVKTIETMMSNLFKYKKNIRKMPRQVFLSATLRIIELIDSYTSFI